MDIIDDCSPTIKYDDEYETAWFNYNPGTGIREVWFDNYTSLDRKCDYILDEELQGLGIWAYGYQEEFDIYEMLSFLLSGINDLTHYNKNNKDFVLIEKRIIWFMKLFDPKLKQNDIHQKAFEKYNKWIQEN